MDVSGDTYCHLTAEDLFVEQPNDTLEPVVTAELRNCVVKTAANKIYQIVIQFRAKSNF